MEQDTSDDMETGFIGSLEPATEDVISTIIPQQLGSVGRRYRRESRRAFKKLVSEIYSPPRVTEELRKMRSKHLMPGFALDLTVIDPDDGRPWDFSGQDKRDKARKLLRSQKPYFLIGSPMCRAFSTWQALNTARSSNPREIKKAYDEAVEHLDFVVSLYVEQLQGGRYFLHEHPQYATSWSVESMEELMKIPGVERAYSDQCQFGAEVKTGPLKGQPVKKPTGFLSKSPEALKSPERRCTGGSGSWACSRP